MPIRKIQELLNALGTAEYSRERSKRQQYAKEFRNESFSSSLTSRGASMSIGPGLLGLEAQGGTYIEPTFPPTELGLDVPTMSNQRAYRDLDELSPNHLTDSDLKAICIRLNALESVIGKSSNSSLPILERLDALEAWRDSVKTPSPNTVSSIAGMDSFLSNSQFELGLGPFLYENDHLTMTRGVDQEFGSFIVNTQNISLGQGNDGRSNDVLSNDNQSLGGQDIEGIARSSTMATSSKLSNIQGGRFNCSHVGCHKTFARKGDYNRHLRLHGTPWFPCQVPGCERVGLRGFSRSDKLLVHHKNNH